MNDPRTRRLAAEHDALRADFAGHAHLTIDPIGWHPPDRYRVTYAVTGVALDATGQPALVERHVVLFSADDSYPREPPSIVVESAIFHPNIGPAIGDEVALLDRWTARMTLADAILLVGETIQFQHVDLDAPLNPVAARWVSENPSVFPVGRVVLRGASSLDDGVSTASDRSRAESAPSADPGEVPTPDSIWAPKPTRSGPGPDAAPE